MHKLILVIIIIIGCSFSAFAQNGNIDTVKIVKENSDVVLTSVEQMPAYPGGMPALAQFLSSNVIYPDAAKRDNIQGKVIVKFVVNKNGKISNMTLERDIGGGCGEEAMRALRAMPAWSPGKQDGVPVNVYFRLPVTFKLGR